MGCLPWLDEVNARVAMVIGCHWVMAITLLFVNKQLVSSEESGQDLTVFIAWAQCVFSTAAIVVASVLKRLVQPSPSPSSPSPWLSFPLLPTLLHSDVLGLTFTFIGVIVMNNLLLKHIDVAFYQVARSSTLLFTVLFSRTILLVPVTVPVLASCLLIILGFAVSVDQEMLLSTLSWLSVFYGILASLFAALSGVFIKRADKLLQGNSLHVSLTSNVNSILFLVPLMLSTGQLRAAWNSEQFAGAAVWGRLALTGVLSLLVGWASNKVISLTSPITHNVSINAKSLLQTLIAVCLNGERRSAVWWLGNALVMLGLVYYSCAKSRGARTRVIHIPGPKK